MSKKQFLKRYLLIINQLRKKPCSFEEIANNLSRVSVLDEENYEVSIRTFQRDLTEIASMYNIEIKYNRSQNVYEIAHDSNDERNDRLMESFELFNALNLTSHYAHHLIPEKRKPLGTENMYGLLHAIKSSVQISFVHEKYWEDEEEKTTRTVLPIALKEAQHRWYLIAQDKGDDKIKTFGLERISNLVISNQKATLKQVFDVDQHFKHAFGIINEEDVAAQDVVLSFSISEAKYIKSLPLHHSQRIINETPDAVTFGLQLYPTYDFVMALLSFGTEVTVLEPESLRKEIKRKLTETLLKYDQ